MDLKKAEDYLNKEIGFVKNTLISYNEVVKAMAKYAESEALNLPVVSNRRELLIAFHDFCVKTVDLSNKDETTEKRVERFEKSNL